MNDLIFRGTTPEANAQMRSYFDTLPPFVQETVQQCGISFATLSELEKCARNMTQAR